MPSRLFTRAVLPALLLALALAAPAGAVGGFGTPSPLGGPAHGVRASAPTQPALDTTLSQLTGGLSAAEVTAQRDCGAAQPGRAACFAKSLVLRDGHRRIHPRVKHSRTFTQVFPSRRPARTARCTSLRRSASTLLRHSEQPRI